MVYSLILSVSIVFNTVMKNRSQTGDELDVPLLLSPAALCTGDELDVPSLLSPAALCTGDEIDVPLLSSPAALCTTDPKDQKKHGKALTGDEHALNVPLLSGPAALYPTDSNHQKKHSKRIFHATYWHNDSGLTRLHDENDEVRIDID